MEGDFHPGSFSLSCTSCTADEKEEKLGFVNNSSSLADSSTEFSSLTLKVLSCSVRYRLLEFTWCSIFKKLYFSPPFSPDTSSVDIPSLSCRFMEYFMPSSQATSILLPSSVSVCDVISQECPIGLATQNVTKTLNKRNFIFTGTWSSKN